NRLDRFRQADGLGITRPVAGDRRRVHFVTRGADRGRGRLKLGARVSRAIDEHVRRHVESSPWFWSRTDLYAPATLAKAGAGNHMHTIIENASVVNAINMADFAALRSRFLTVWWN